MLSIILYGKNDHHGYNYHKRLSISLNCIAELLTGKQDEIIFVDDGSPTGFPTVIEAVQDTFTPKTLSKLKVFRTRDQASSSPRESISRNIGIRHSNPKNEWILSTNIDMVFVPLNPADSLTSIVESLPKGFYQLPRLELPENLWEKHLDRMDPQKNLTLIRKEGSRLSLDLIVRRPEYLSFDNPGDFQLMPREAIYEIGGFHEEMTKGWHVDSNLSKRMSLYFDSSPLSLEDKLSGYHCNHTRQMTVSHVQNATENSWDLFVKKVTTPFLHNQAMTWGRVLNEQIVLTKENLFSPYPHPPRSHDILLNHLRFNTLSYHTETIVPHLIDHFHHLPKKAKIGFIGSNSSLISYLKSYFPIIEPVDYSTFEKFYRESHLIIFDFGFEENGSPISPSHPNYQDHRKKLKSIMSKFIEVTQLERNQTEKKKLLGINVLFTDFQALFYCHLHLYKTTPFTGISLGYTKDDSPYKWKKGKKELKFLLMYLALRHFYFRTDFIRSLCYKTPILKKFLAHK